MISKFAAGLLYPLALAASAAAVDTAPAPRPKAVGTCCCCAAPAAGTAGQPAGPATKTISLVVDDLTCAGCAKSVAKAVAAVAGVEAATADLKTKTLSVTPQAGKKPSAKALWEAVEKAGYKPTKLAGPDGTHEKKPTD